MKTSYLVAFVTVCVVALGGGVHMTSQSANAQSTSSVYDDTGVDFESMAVTTYESSDQPEANGSRRIGVSVKGTYESGRYPHIVPVSVTLSYDEKTTTTTTYLYPTIEPGKNSWILRENSAYPRDYETTSETQPEFLVTFDEAGEHEISVDAHIIGRETTSASDTITQSIDSPASRSEITQQASIREEYRNENERSVSVPAQYRASIGAEAYLESTELPQGQNSRVIDFSSMSDITEGSAEFRSQGTNPVDVTVATPSIPSTLSQTVVIEYIPTGEDITIEPLGSDGDRIDTSYTLPNDPSSQQECHASSTGESNLCIYRLTSLESEIIDRNNELILRYTTEEPNAFEVQCQQVISGGLEGTDGICGTSGNSFTENTGAVEDPNDGPDPVALPGGPYRLGFERESNDIIVDSVGTQTQVLTEKPNEDWFLVNDSPPTEDIPDDDSFTVTLRNTPNKESLTTLEREQARRLLEEQYGSSAGWTISNVSVKNKVNDEYTYIVGDGTPSGQGWERDSGETGVRQVITDTDGNSDIFPSFTGPADMPGFNDVEGSNWVVDYSTTPTTIVIINQTSVTTDGPPGDEWSEVNDNLGVKVNRTGYETETFNLEDKLDITVDNENRWYYVGGSYEYARAVVEKTDFTGYEQIEERTYYTYTRPTYESLHRYHRSVYDIDVTFTRGGASDTEFSVYQGPKYTASYKYLSETADFDGSDSFDPDGTLEEFKWEYNTDIYESSTTIDGDTSQITATYEGFATPPNPFESEYHTLSVTDNDGNIGTCTFEVQKEPGATTTSLQPEITDVRVDGPVDVRTERIEILVDTEGEIDDTWDFTAYINKDSQTISETNIKSIEHVAGKDETLRLLISPGNDDFSDSLGLSSDDTAIEHTVVVTATAPAGTNDCGEYIEQGDTSVSLYTIECAAPNQGLGTDCPEDGYITPSTDFQTTSWGIRDSDKDGIMNYDDECPYFVGDCTEDEDIEDGSSSGSSGSGGGSIESGLIWTESDDSLYPTVGDRYELDTNTVGDFYRSCTQLSSSQLDCTPLTDLSNDGDLIESSTQLKTTKTTGFSDTLQPAYRLYEEQTEETEGTTDETTTNPDNLIVWYDFKDADPSSKFIEDKSSGTQYDGKIARQCTLIDRLESIVFRDACNTEGFVAEHVDPEIDAFVMPIWNKGYIQIATPDRNGDKFADEFRSTDEVYIEYKAKVIPEDGRGVQGQIISLDNSEFEDGRTFYSRSDDSVQGDAGIRFKDVGEIKRFRGETFNYIHGIATKTQNNDDGTWTPATEVVSTPVSKSTEIGVAPQKTCVQGSITNEELKLITKDTAEVTKDTDFDVSNEKSLIVGDETNTDRAAVGADLLTDGSGNTVARQVLDKFIIYEVRIYNEKPTEEESLCNDARVNNDIENAVRNDITHETTGYVQTTPSPVSLSNHQLRYQGSIDGNGLISAKVLAVEETSAGRYTIVDSSDEMTFRNEYDTQSGSQQPTRTQQITGLSTTASAYALEVKFEGVQSEQTDVEQFTVEDISDPPPEEPTVVGPDLFEVFSDATGPVSPTEDITFTAAASAGTYNGATVPVDRYRFNFGDGTQRTVTANDIEGGSRESITHNYQCGGSYTVTATAIDDQGNTDSRTAQVTVDDSDVTANTNKNSYSAEVGQSITFDASSSTGDIESYSWRFSDGRTYTGEQITRTFSSAGSYSVTLTVDAIGCDASAITRSITIQDQEEWVTIIDDEFDTSSTRGWYPDEGTLETRQGGGESILAPQCSMSRMTNSVNKDIGVETDTFRYDLTYIPLDSWDGENLRFQYRDDSGWNTVWTENHHYTGRNSNRYGSVDCYSRFNSDYKNSKTGTITNVDGTLREIRFTNGLNQDNHDESFAIEDVEIDVRTKPPEVTISGDGRNGNTHDSCSVQNSDDDIKWIDVERVSDTQLDISVKYNPRRTGTFTENDGVNIKLWYHDQSSGSFTEIDSYIDDPVKLNSNTVYSYTWNIPLENFDDGSAYIRAGIEDRADRNDEIRGSCADNAESSHYDNADQRIILTR